MIVGYLVWHYSYAYVDGYSIFRGGIHFLWNYFSCERLAHTLTHPFRVYPASAFRTHLSRMYGISIRSIMLALALASMCAWVGVAIGTALVWPFLPLVTAGGLIASGIGLMQTL